ncbi:hypothetical protein M444_36820 (plasmid) [Streptomyces sp. Mg1]|nr:hypothetical protein M444_36820 [Streptomyces sp. Mg1]
MRRGTPVCVAAVALLVLVTGCGGGHGDAGKGMVGTPPAESAARPLPLGTEARRATWKKRPVQITPKGLLSGSRGDLAGIRLDDELKDMDPYFLTVEFSNTGELAMDRPNLADTLSVVGTNGVSGKGVMIVNMALATAPALPEHCRKGNPATVPAGGTAEVCVLVMLAKGQEPATVAYSAEGSDTVVWKVGDGLGGGGGGALPAGTPAEAAVDDGKGHLVPVKATPTTVRAGDPADLSRSKAGDGGQDLVPYYVTVEYLNTGRYDVYPGMQDHVWLQSAGGKQVRPVILLDVGGPGVAQCPKTVPDTMVKPNATVRQCSIHMLPKGDGPATISYKGDDADAKWITWRAS